jgi:Na+/phosphate symporter
MALKEMALKDLVSEMHDLTEVCIEGIDLTYTGLLYGNRQMADEAATDLEKVMERVVPMTEDLVKIAKDDTAAAVYVSVPTHIQRMGENLNRIIRAVKKKIEDDMLFSDKAMVELEYMFERTRDIIVNAKDLVLARNTLVARHIIEAQRATEVTANHYATMHEERLIEGLCSPSASGNYLEILEAFKSMSWHAKEIAKDLAG